MSDERLLKGLIRLAHANPSARKDLLPIIKEGAGQFVELKQLNGSSSFNEQQLVDAIRDTLRTRERGLSNISVGLLQWDGPKETTPAGGLRPFSFNVADNDAPVPDWQEWRGEVAWDIEVARTKPSFGVLWTVTVWKASGPR